MPSSNPFRVGVSYLVLTAPMMLLVLGAAQAEDEVRINKRWASDRVLVTWACDYFQGTNMGVVVTEDGLVVIDTGLSPTTVRRQRAAVEAELGRSDFRYLVNTHMHNDHAFADQVFPEATIVAPAHGTASLEGEVTRIPELLERLRRSQASYRERAAATSPDSLDGKLAREGVAAFAVGIADLEQGIEPCYPAVTFDGRHTLELGDLHLQLVDFRGLHSDSDILILVQEEGVLFTGDAFWGGRLPLLTLDAPGDLDRLLENWRLILESSPGIEVMVPGHSDVPLTVDQFRGMYQYVSRLWEDVRTAREAGTPLVRFFMGNVFSERYPEVADFRHIQREYNLHQHNIYVLWGLAGRS